MKLPAEESIANRSYGLLAGFAIVLVNMSWVPAGVFLDRLHQLLAVALFMPSLLSVAYLIVKDKATIIGGVMLISWAGGPANVATALAGEVGGGVNAFISGILLSVLLGILTGIWCTFLDMVARILHLGIEASVELIDVRRGFFATIVMRMLIFCSILAGRPLLLGLTGSMSDGAPLSMDAIHWFLLILLPIAVGFVGATISGTNVPTVVIVGALTAVSFAGMDLWPLTSTVPAMITVMAMVLGAIGAGGARALERWFSP